MIGPPNAIPSDCAAIATPRHYLNKAGANRAVTNGGNPSDRITHEIEQNH